MAINLGRGFFTVGLDGDLRKQINEAAAHMHQQMGAAARQVGMAFTAMGGAITGALALSIKAFTAQENAERQLEAVLKSTANAAGLTAEELKNMASEFQKVTTYGDETVISAQNVLLTFTSIGKEVFPTAIGAALDMSAALGQDLQSSVIMIGKALQDPIVGMTALRRVGVNVTGMLKEQVTALVESGDMMGAQKLILAELASEFGGSAAAGVETFTGRMTQLKNTVGDLQEVIGKVLADKLRGIAVDIKPIVESIIAWTQQNSALTESIVMFTAALGAAMLVIGPLLLALPGLAVAVGALLTPFGALAAILLTGVVVAFAAFREEIVGGMGFVSAYVREHWDAISGAFLTGVDVVSSAMTWLWESIIQPVWGFIFAVFERALDFMRENWEQIQDVFWTGAGIVEAAMQAVLNIIMTIFDIIGMTIGAGLHAISDSWNISGDDWLSTMQRVLEAFERGMTWFMEKTQEVRAWVEEHWTAMSFVIEMFAETIVTPIQNAVSIIWWLIDAVATLVNIIPGWLIEFLMKAANPLGAINELAAAGWNAAFGNGEEPRSKGGRVEAGNTYRVGERGPEMFFNQQGNQAKLVGKNGEERAHATQDGWIVPNNLLRIVSHIYRTLYPNADQKDARDRATRRVVDDYGFPHIYPGNVSSWIARQFSRNELFLKMKAVELGYRAAGGPVDKNKPYIVGELGPELFIPKAAGQILNKQQMGTSVTFNGPLVNVARMDASNPADVNALAQRLGDELRRRLSARGLQPNFGV